MATLQSLVNHPDVTPALRNRYSTAVPGTTIIPFVQWANDLLEELQERGFLPSLIKERGILIENKRWVTKPSDLIQLIKVYNPEDDKEEYRVEDVENKFKFLDWEFEEEGTSDRITASAFGSYGNQTITCTGLTDTTKYQEDYFENYLFYITAGTWANIGIVVASSDAATSPGGTKIDFFHAQSSALSGTIVTAARLVPPQYYVMMKYRASITQVSSLSDEFPVENDCENRLVPVWLRWKAERALQATSKESLKWENEVEKILYSIQAARLSRVITPSRGRRLAGFERNLKNYSKPHPDYSSF